MVLISCPHSNGRINKRYGINLRGKENFDSGRMTKRPHSINNFDPDVKKKLWLIIVYGFDMNVGRMQVRSVCKLYNSTSAFIECIFVNRFFSISLKLINNY